MIATSYGVATSVRVNLPFTSVVVEAEQMTTVRLLRGWPRSSVT